MVRTLLAACAVLVSTLTATGADRAAAREFLEITGFDVAITSMQDSAKAGPSIAGGDPDAFGYAWVRLAEEVFEPESLIEETLDMMEAIVPDALIEHGIEFYGSPLGQKLVEAENASQSVSGDRQLAEGEVIVTRLADENPARIDVYRRMNDAIGGVQSSARAIIEVQLRYVLAAAAAGASDIQYSEAELREILGRQMDVLVEALSTNSVFGSAFVYQDFSDEEVVAYLDALEHPQMKEIYEVLNGIQYQLMGDRYEELAAKLAGLSPQTDL